MQVKFGVLKLQHITFSNITTFSVSVFGLISTAFLYKFPYATCCSHRSEVASKNGIFPSWEQSPSKLRDLTSYGKIKRCLQKSDRYHGAKRWIYGFCKKRTNVKHSMKFVLIIRALLFFVIKYNE